VVAEKSEVIKNMKYKRITKEAEFEQFAEITSFAFGIKSRVNKRIIELLREAEGQRKCSIHGVFDGNKLVSSLVIFNFDMHFRDDILPMGGIAFVCSRPEYRGKGYIRYLLNKSIEVMNSNNLIISTLYPFSIDFYRKYGWEFFEKARYVRISMSAIMDFDIKDYDFEILKTADKESIDFYNNLVRSSYNLTLRDEWIWNNWILKGFNVENLRESEITRQLVKITRNGKVVALMPFVLYKDNEGRNRIRVEHLATKGIDNIKACFNFLKRLSHQFSEFDIFLPMDLNISFLLRERTVKHEIRELAMLRVINLEKFSGLRIRSADFSLVVKITDKNASWNDGIFEISCANNVLKISRCTKQPDFEMNIRTTSAVLSGFISLKEAIKTGLVKEYRDTDISDDILPKETTFMVDFF